MKKMMICRSSGLALWSVVVMLGATPAAAQDSLTAEGNQIHVVRAGETLWALAEFYLGDPYLWPRIYRLNPGVVEDPHWIFPGERLLLLPGEPVAVTAPPISDPGQDQSTPDGPPPDVVAPIQEQAAPPPPPPAAPLGAETVFASNRSRTGTPTMGPGRPVSRNPSRMAFYSSGFLTELEPFPWAHIAGATDQSTFGTLTATSAASIHEHVALMAPANATYQVGDSLLSAHLSREVAGWGNVVKPTGILVVTAVSGRDVLATVVSQFGRITDGQVALPIEPYRDAGSRSVPVENGLAGQIITTRDQNTVPHEREVIFIDKGRSQGVALGDVFEVFLERAEFPGSRGRIVAELTVVHVRGRSSTAHVTQMSDIGFGRGTSVRLIRRARS